MASTGKFYPFNRYINDIALLMDGTHKSIPSKYILLKKLINSGTEIIGPGGGVESVSKMLDTQLNKSGIKSKIYSLKSAKSYKNAVGFNISTEKLSARDIKKITEKITE